jgi:hypothetical protein
MIETPFSHAATSGPLVLAIGAAALAGLVSILSPCVLPLVPGYLSFVTGLTGSDLDASTVEADGDTVVKTRPVAVKGRILAGTSLFVLGFAVVYTLIDLRAVLDTVHRADPRRRHRPGHHQRRDRPRGDPGAGLQLGARRPVHPVRPVLP